MSHNIPSRFFAQLYNYRYDQLNRIMEMDMYRGLITNTNLWSSLAKDTTYMERYKYDPNGNIKKVMRNGNLSANPLMDNLTYVYQSGNNRLDHIRDTTGAGVTSHSSNYGATVDIKDQASGNYAYNAIGELNYDRISNIDSIKWNVYGKMQHMYKRAATGANATTLHYYYDPSGNRVGKGIQYGSTTSSSNVYTWYVRDAQGNVLAVYKVEGSSLTTTPLKLVEHHIYGSSRLGIINRNIDADQTERVTTDATNANLGKTYLANFTRGNKLFELTNHLGNVLLTVTDAKVPTALVGTPSQVGSYSVNMVTATDYTPFGMIMQGRNYNTAAATKYRYGFNGKEWENEPKSNGNQIDYGFRMYDPRVGRFLSVDPIAKQYPMLTPFQYASNSPIVGIDLDGLEFSHPMTVEAGLNYIETKTGQEAMKGDVKAQEAFNTMMSTKMKIGFTQFSIASTFVMGPYVGMLGRGATGTVIRIVTNPMVVTSASSIGMVAAKYGPDVANFTYGLFTGDVLEPVPTYTSSQMSDVGALLRNVFKGPVKIDGWLKAAGVVEATFIKGSTSKKVAVIGEGMQKVLKVGEGLKNAEIFVPSEKAVLQWAELLKNNVGKELSEDVIKGTKMWSENKAWINKVKEEGYDVLDTGGGSKSLFYKMEKEVVYGTKKD